MIKITDFLLENMQEKGVTILQYERKILSDQNSIPSENNFQKQK